MSGVTWIVALGNVPIVSPDLTTQHPPSSLTWGIGDLKLILGKGPTRRWSPHRKETRKIVVIGKKLYLDAKI